MPPFPLAILIQEQTVAPGGGLSEWPQLKVAGNAKELRALNARRAGWDWRVDGQ